MCNGQGGRWNGECIKGVWRQYKRKLNFVDGMLQDSIHLNNTNIFLNDIEEFDTGVLLRLLVIYMPVKSFQQVFPLRGELG